MLRENFWQIESSLLNFSTHALHELSYMYKHILPTDPWGPLSPGSPLGPVSPFSPKQRSQQWRHSIIVYSTFAEVVVAILLITSAINTIVTIQKKICTEDELKEFFDWNHYIIIWGRYEALKYPMGSLFNYNPLKLTS